MLFKKDKVNPGIIRDSGKSYTSLQSAIVRNLGILISSFLIFTEYYLTHVY